MRFRLISLCLFASLCSTAGAVSIYNGSLNTFPEQQGFLDYLSIPAAVTKTVNGGKTLFDTGAAGTKGGWSSYDPIGLLPVIGFPQLDRTNGFSLGFDVKVVSESHLNNDRAGFDVILLGSDHQGVELGFWTNEVWAQMLSGGAFVHGEGNTTVTTTSTTHYDLGILGSTYTLSANGNQILTGPVRDYSSAMAVPYGLNNYLFVGDDTTSATASIELSSLSIVPEPGSVEIVLAACGLALTRKRR